MSSSEEEFDDTHLLFFVPNDANADQNPKANATQNDPKNEMKTKEENEYNKQGEYIHSFNNLISIIESTKLFQAINESTKMYSTIIAQMIITADFIDIDYKTMLLNISKKGWSSADGTYGLKNLFISNSRCYCSSGDSGNCVDLLLDLQHEYTLNRFHAWTTGWGYTCPLIKAYLWVFGAKTALSVDHIKQLCAEKLYAKKKFEQLKVFDFDIIDPETNERRRDEMVPVSCVDGSNEAESKGWKLDKKIASHIKGRYILIKLISTGNSNVDAKYVGIQGYKM